MSTSDPFSLVLHFYFNFQRTKLNSADLDRIAKKYHSKPASLLSDLAKKYPYWTIPHEVSVTIVKKYVLQYGVPKAYLMVMQRDPNLSEALKSCDNHQQDDRLNPMSTAFDPIVALQTQLSGNSLLLSTSYKIQCVDNINRIGTMIKPYCEVSSTEDNLSLLDQTFLCSVYLHNVRNSVVHPFANINTDKSEKVDVQSQRKHIFEVIAEYASPSLTTKNSNGDNILSESPLGFLKTLMLNKERVRVILRRKNSMRGHLDGFIRAFDKHFNMIMYDVDEEYITNRQKKRKTAFGKFLNQRNVLHRYLPQLIVRGDVVVSVFRVPRTPMQLPIVEY